MEARYKYYLKTADQSDWTLLADEPEGWQELQEEIVRDFEIHGLLVNTKATLVFSGDGFNFIRNVFDCQSFCAEIQIRIEEQCGEGSGYTKAFDGLIKMGDVKFYLNVCKCETPVIDNSYYARIKNNADIEAHPNIGKSKNGFPITPAAMNPCIMFDPITATYEVGTTRKAYRAFELFKFFIAFMSDGDLEFASDLFDTGDFAGEFITNGKHLSTNIFADYDNPEIGAFSFKTLIDEFYNVCNLGFTIEYGGLKPVLRIENSDWFYGNNVTDVLTFANGVTEKIKTEQLYTLVNFGSSKTDKDTPTESFPEDIDFYGFKDEQFHLTGQCNRADASLEIKGEWIRSSNVIQDILMGINANPQTEYDEDFIFISAESTGPGTYQAIQYDIFSAGVPPYYYNGNITNDKIALRFFGAVPNSIVAFLGNSDNRFKATSTTNKTSGGRIPCDNESTGGNFDASGNYDNALFEYVAPASGIYTFHVSGRISAIHFTIGHSAIVAFIQRLDSSNVFIENAPDAFRHDFYGMGIIANVFFQQTYTFNLIAGDKIIYLTDHGAGIYFALYAGAVFECTKVIGGAQDILQEYNSEDFKSIQYKFEYPISNARWKNIIANPKDKLAFNIDGLNDYRPWIENIQYNKKESMATVTLLGKQKNKLC